MIAIGDAIRKDYGDSQKSLASDGSHNQWPRAARQASQNKKRRSRALRFHQNKLLVLRQRLVIRAALTPIVGIVSQQDNKIDESKAEPMSHYLANQFIQGTILEYMNPDSLFSRYHTPEKKIDNAYLWYESWPHHSQVKAGIVNSRVYDDGCFTVLVKNTGSSGEITNFTWVCSVETKRDMRILDPESLTISTAGGDCQRLGQNIAEMWATIYRRIWTAADFETAEAMIDRLSDENLRVFLIIFQHTHFQIATTRFTKEYLKSYLVPGYDSDLSSENYYLTVDLSYRRDVAKRTHRRDAIVMMASLIDYFYNVHIINASPILSSTVGDGLDGHQAAGYDIGGSGDFLPRPEDENPDYLMEDGEGSNEEDLANEDRENYGGNQMDEDYDAESYPRHDLGGNFVDELSYIVAPAQTKRRKL
ncbi:hypothetical protein AOL_s00080g39 [Orbilia oligospora ATCC 24927]|uniref:Uncharacterized protein n=1 Tax=Arthrobotrys oligospora (strain ATCC 24927 / CBS 115.81 / DSM 1491) TaxID=756982 RepID=G1XE04_ARTOA|nr:hypothetical protein AOL_s00080g39 [Orbilia oligospora ATCC 24927]EGX48410.1 hypothetical protein AOL_s00080g39 [Orbilia oligospora ATCC 24927]